WQYRYLSPVVQRITGRSPGMFLEDPLAWELAVAEEDLPSWRAFRAALARGQGGEIEYRLTRPDHSRLWVRESVLAMPDEGGARVLHGVVTDVTQRKQVEEAARLQDRFRRDHLEGL